MAKTIVGDVIVRFGADTQTFSVALDSANAKLRAAGKGWAATLSQLPKATRDAAAQASQDFKKIGQAAKESAAAVDAAGRKQEGTITRLMATRALTRGLSGTPSITSAERFLGNYLNLGDYAKSIFPVTGGLAVGVLLNELVGKAEAAYAALKKMETAPQRIAAAFQTLNGKIGQSNDELALSNDKLRNAIAVLQGGKTNNLAIMLDEARVAADKLSGSLKADLASVSSLLQANSTSWWAQALGKAGTGDINKLFQGANGYGGFQKQISDIMLNANQALATAKTPGDPFTDEEQPVEMPGCDWWELDVSLPPLKNADARPWLAFLAALRGRTNIFQCGDPTGATPQGTPTGTPVLKSEALFGADSIITSGWTASSSGNLLPGDYIGLGYYMHAVVGSQVDADSSGDATIEIFPSVRMTLAAATSITTSNVTSIFRLDSNSREATLSEGGIWSIRFKAIEARGASGQ